MSHLATQDFQSLQIAVLTVSDTRTLQTDDSGQTLADALREAGHVLAERRLVVDDIHQIRAVVCAWIADPRIQVGLITGGTGFTARDNTPQAVEPLLERRVEGFGELFRQVSLGEIGTSSKSAPYSVQSNLITTYYPMVNSSTDPRFVGGFFWWNYAEQMVPYTTTYWTLLRNTIQPLKVPK